MPLRLKGTDLLRPTSLHPHGLTQSHLRRGVRSSRSEDATATPAASSAWQTTCFIVNPLPLAVASSALTVARRTRRLRVVDRSSARSATWVGGCSGAALLAIANASAGEGRRG